MDDLDQDEFHRRELARESGPTSEAEFAAIERRAQARELAAEAAAANARLDQALFEQRRQAMRDLDAALLDIYRTSVAIERRAQARELAAEAAAANARLDQALFEQRRQAMRDLDAALLDIYRTSVQGLVR